MKWLKTLLLILIFLMNLKNALAYEKEFVITDIVSDHTVQIQRLDKLISLVPGDILAIYSHESKDVLGYARVQSLTDNSDLFIASIESHHRSGLIRAENFLKKYNLTEVSNDVPARFDLIVREDKQVAAKYKPLVYAGVVNGMTASNLIKNEYLAGPFILGYGVTSNFQLNTSLMSAFFNVANVSFKNKLVTTDDLDFSFENGFQYFPKTHRGSYQFNAYLDTTSNSNFKSYAKLKIFTQKPEDQTFTNNEEYRKDLNVELQFATSFIQANWNRVIFGPKIDVNKRRVGGIVSYFIIDKNFNSMLGVSSNDFSEFRLGKQGYLINLDFWWRF